VPASPIDNILNRLNGVQRSGRGWKALCPSHNDVNPSLQIDVEGDLILAHCHAGCGFPEIRQALQTSADDWRMPSARRGRTVVATYDYVDKQGNML